MGGPPRPPPPVPESMRPVDQQQRPLLPPDIAGLDEEEDAELPGEGDLDALPVDLPDRLKRCAARWEEMGASETILSWIKHNYPIEWMGERPPPFEAPNRLTGKSFCTDVQAEKFMDDSLETMLNVGAVVERRRDQCVVLSPLSVAPKKGGTEENPKLRLIMDLRFCNRYVRRRVCKLESLNKARWNITPGAWMSAIDVSSAYWHVQLREEDMPWISFAYKGRYYSWRSLPFGLTSAPSCFSRLMRVPVKVWRKSGMALVHYMDDINLHSPACDQTNKNAKTCIGDLISLGWLVNKEKCTAEAAVDVVDEDGEAQVLPAWWGVARQSLEFLGFVVDTISHTFDISNKRRKRIVRQINLLLSKDAENEGGAPVELIASVNGYIVSLELALGEQTRFMMRSVQRSLNDRPHRKNCNGECTKACYRGRVTLTAKTRRDLEFARDVLIPRAHGMPLWTRLVECSALSLWTDASEHSMGGGVGGDERVASGPLPGVTTENLIYHTTEEGRDSICVADGDGTKESSYLRELRAIIFSLRALLDSVEPGTSIALRVDNQGVYYDLGAGRGNKREDDHEVLYEIFTWCAEKQVHLVVDWCPRELNSWADWASKICDVFAWKIKEDTCDTICKMWRGMGEVDIDMFASMTTRQSGIGKFCSRWAQPESSGDARAIDWSTFSTIWAAPPACMLPFAIRKAFEANARMILIAPTISFADWRRWITPQWSKGVVPLKDTDFIPALFGERVGTSPDPHEHRVERRFVPRHRYSAYLIDFSKRKETDYLGMARSTPASSSSAESKTQ